MGLGSVEVEPKGRLFVHVILGGELSGEGQVEQHVASAGDRS